MGREEGKRERKEAEELIGMEEAIALLKTSRSAFYRWLRTGKVKGMKVGRQWRFRRHDIENFAEGEAPRIELRADISPLIEKLRGQLKEIGGVDASSPETDELTHLIHLIIRLGAEMQASDLHIAVHIQGDETPIQGDEKEVAAVLRYRVDGVLQPAAEIDLRILPRLVERWKGISGCNVQEVVRPQDGRMVMEVAPGKVLDIRLSFLPAALGESLTGRVLDRNVVPLSLDRLGYTTENKERLVQALHRGWGLIIFAGPSGSGTTTAMYACLRHVSSSGIKTLTVEDPVEFILPWAVQIPLRSEVGLTFPVAMRAMMRSGPDVLMVGQVRDRETADMVQKMALTGHLVLTSLHADESARVLRRMKDMGSEPFAICEATRLVISQRLVRLLCPECSAEGVPSPELVRKAEELIRAGGLDGESLPKNFRNAVGCNRCRKTGFRGRRVIAEFLEVTPEIRRALENNGSLEELRKVAVSQGMVTMAADGISLAASGQTTLAEIFRTLAVK